MTTFDCTAAQKMLGVLAKARETGSLSGKELEEAMATAGYRLFIDHHNRFSPGTLTQEQFCAMLAAAVSGDEGYRPPNVRLERMFPAFSGALDRLDRLEDLLVQVEQSDWQERASQRALRWLPEGADLSAEVHFLLDGCSGGYVLGKRIGMDLLQYNGQLDQLEGVIAHELHHVGYQSVAAPGREGGPEGMEARLVEMFLGEGSATTLVFGQPRPGDEGYSEWEQHERRMGDHFAKTREYLARLAAGGVSAEEFERDVPTMYLQGRWGVGYAVGATMVRTVLSALGEQALFACMRRPETFLETYRRAVACLRAKGGEGELHDL